MADAQTQRAGFRLIQSDEMQPIRCSCGMTRRLFTDEPGAPASFHLNSIENDAQAHYHKKMTEIYYILDGEGEMELDGERYPVRPGSAIMIHPGCRHRAIGYMKLINVPIPAFDPNDEYFD